MPALPVVPLTFSSVLDRDEPPCSRIGMVFRSGFFTGSSFFEKERSPPGRTLTLFSLRVYDVGIFWADLWSVSLL